MKERVGKKEKGNGGQVTEAERTLGFWLTGRRIKWPLYPLPDPNPPVFTFRFSMPILHTFPAAA